MAVPGSPWQERVAELVGAVTATRPIGGEVWLVEAGGRSLVAKTGPGTLDEAAGLRRLGAVPGAPPVPDVVLAEPGLLVTTAVEQGVRRPTHDAELGQSLAALHSATWPEWGGGSGFIGDCRVDPVPQPDAATFYGARLGALAARCGLERRVDAVVARLDELLPPDGPSLVHGDLWWGNVLFGTDGRSWLIDPSVHGGHAEEDLAMLALFGRVPEHLLTAYTEIHPLHEGWGERVELFQLYPLLVHSVLFGGAYRERAEAIAVRFA